MCCLRSLLLTRSIYFCLHFFYTVLRRARIICNLIYKHNLWNKLFQLCPGSLSRFFLLKRTSYFVTSTPTRLKQTCRRSQNRQLASPRNQLSKKIHKDFRELAHFCLTGKYATPHYVTLVEIYAEKLYPH